MEEYVYGPMVEDEFGDPLGEQNFMDDFNGLVTFSDGW